MQGCCQFIWQVVPVLIHGTCCNEAVKVAQILLHLQAYCAPFSFRRTWSHQCDVQFSCERRKCIGIYGRFHNLLLYLLKEYRFIFFVHAVIVIKAFLYSFIF